jgi:hypothetical protein
MERFKFNSVLLTCILMVAISLVLVRLVAVLNRSQ